jgi:hypothetical protein
MGEKFDNLVGNFKVKIGEKDYPFSMTLRQRGTYNNLRMKMNDELIISFLYERFKDGFTNANKAIGTTVSPEELAKYEEELNMMFLTNYETVTTKVMLALGMVTQEQLDKMSEDAEKTDIVKSFLEKTLEEREKEEKGR